jgi:hypothetical protein
MCSQALLLPACMYAGATRSATPPLCPGEANLQEADACALSARAVALGSLGGCAMPVLHEHDNNQFNTTSICSDKCQLPSRMPLMHKLVPRLNLPSSAHS